MYLMEQYQFLKDNFLIAALFTLVIGLCVNIFINVFLYYLGKSLSRLSSFYTSIFIKSVKVPLILFAWLSILSSSIQFFYSYELSGYTYIFFDGIKENSLIFILLYFSYNFLIVSEQELKTLDKEDSNTTKRYAVTRVATIIILSIIATIILDTLAIDIGAFVAFGAAGTIIFGIAAKDLLSNLFGSLIVFIDKPFIIGDKISSHEKKFSGIVEHIGWRLTKIRSEQGYAIFIPNSTFTSVSIQNESIKK